MSDDIMIYGENDGAKKVTVTGWIDTKGRFFGDQEDLARYSSCTHKRCECGTLMKKGWTRCPKCRESEAKKRFFEKELTTWDGETPLYCERYDKYFFNENQIYDFLADDNERSLSDLRLLLCEPVQVPHFDTDLYEDLSNEDGEMVELPQALVDAINHLNEVAQKELSRCLWEPTNKRVDLKEMDA